MDFSLCNRNDDLTSPHHGLNFLLLYPIQIFHLDTDIVGLVLPDRPAPAAPGRSTTELSCTQREKE